MLILGGAVVILLLAVHAVAGRADVRLVLTRAALAVQSQGIRLGNLSGVIGCQWQTSEPDGRAASAQLPANFQVLLVRVIVAGPEVFEDEQRRRQYPP